MGSKIDPSGRANGTGLKVPPVFLLLLVLFIPLSQGCIFLGAIPLAAVGIGVGLGLDTDEEEEFEPAPTSPRISGVWPNQGPEAGGTAVQVFGIRFQSGATVTIGGNPALNVAFVSDTELTCDTPSGVSGPADVEVTNPDTQSDVLSGGFTYIPPPSITSFTPS
ncbi:MAG: IPT/TIG domain-containing protein, partial [Planctomycetota bacterium]